MPDPNYHLPTDRVGAAETTTIWKFAFKSADIFFKLVSWLFLTVALRTATNITGNFWISLMTWIVGSIYGLVLMALAFFLIAGAYDRSLILPNLYPWVRILGALAGIALMALLMSPLLLMDQLVDTLAAGLRR